jgi:putative peptidoglycan lipid II flippase
MLCVLLSRVLGFLREWLVAHQFGSNSVTDAYYAAFTLPDFLNYLVAGGSLSLTFIPVFTKYVSEQKEDQAWHVFSTVISVMSLLLLAFVVGGEVFTPQLVLLIAPGFKPQEMARLIFLTRLMLPAQVCFYLGSILSAVQYARTRFLLPSLAPVVYNFCIILGGLLLAPKVGITGFSIGVLAGAFLGNFLLQVYGAARAGATFRPNFDLGHPGFRLFIKLTIPIMLALSLVFTDDWINRWFGSYLVPASITWLSYAKNLMRVPLGVIGQAVGVASFPFLAQLYSEGKMKELTRTLDATMKGLLLLLIPVSALTIAESKPLVHFVFSHTKLHGGDYDATAATLAMYSLGMFAWGLQNILARGFYAVRDTITPAVVGTLLTFLNLPVYWYMFHQLQHLGLALASSIGITIYTAVLFVLLARRLGDQAASQLVIFFLRVSAASMTAGLVAWEITRWFGGRWGWQTPLHALATLVTASSAGLLLTVIFAKLLRVEEVDVYLRKLLRRA